MSQILDTKLTNLSKEQHKLWALRHTAEHVLHTAMQNLYPNLKKAMGPATDEGFYHDYDLNDKVSESDFPKIETEMRKLISADLKMEQELISQEKAQEIFKDNPYKLEWLKDINKRGEKVSIYKMGNKDVDLCSGPHAKSTGEIKAFKLLSVAGAYWHGDEKNKMLSRIYGTAFYSKEDLDKYIWALEEAKKRDHRMLGKKLDLFVINEDIGKGLPLLTPKGTVIRDEIEKYERFLEKQTGFLHVWTPQIAKSEIYKKTGHWEHYKDMMYAPFGIDNETYVLKPMNCPHHYMIYNSQPRSYRDLPLRYAEIGTCYRYEKTGELGGLTRVRALSIDDSHILMREDQIDNEFDLCISLILKMFKAFNLTDYWVRLSINDPADNIKYIADADTWKKAGQKLENIIKRNKLKYILGKGEASFYGPKIDFLVKDAIGREWQMSTLQLDLFMAKKLNLVYIDKDNQERHPVILHRGLTGSLERTIGILIEHYAGNFPTWLNPVQVKILPISDKHLSYAQEVFEKLKKADIRVELDDRSDRLQAKIRDAQLQKVSYMLIIGDKEIASKTVSERARSGKTDGPFPIETFIENLRGEIDNRTNT